MYRLIFFFLASFLISSQASAQNAHEKVIYIVDSIPVLNDPEEGNDIEDQDISDVNVIKNKDTLKLLGYEKFDGAIYIFTKEYRSRSEELKRIPSTGHMEKSFDTWYFRGQPYTGKFIDYFYSGRKQGEGILEKGKLDGRRFLYYQNGRVEVERHFTNGIANGEELTYFEDGSLKQKGTLVNNREVGVWEMYFPSGQVKQRTNFSGDQGDAETTIYYSNGKILAVEITKNGKTSPDKRLEKIDKAMDKGHADYKEEDYKSAVKNYSKAIELDSTYAEAYFARGTVKLNDFQFDEAIIDFNKALALEPYHERALSNRAFARIRKYQFGSSRELSNSNGVTVMASKDNPGIPESELSSICADLKQAIFLGDKGKMIMDTYKEFCGGKGQH